MNLAENQLCGVDGFGQGTYTTKGIIAIAEALKVTASLTEVLAFPFECTTTSLLLITLASSVLCCVCALQLNLSANQLCGLDRRGRGTYTAEGITAIANALKVMASLTKILVSYNNLGDEGATILCDALRESTVSKVQELDFEENNIGPDVGMDSSP